MDRKLQAQALIEILESCDVIIASSRKVMASKVGRKLGVKLGEMGVKSEEAEKLFEMVRKRVVDDPEEMDFYVFVEPEGSDLGDYVFLEDEQEENGDTETE